MRDCRQLVGDDCEDVNRWLDEFSSIIGPTHRFKRHHREGIREAQEIFGERGRKAATVHILRDCRNIPRKRDYEDGSVDKLGLLAKWPVTAYIRYADDSFERLAMYALSGPEAVLNLGFVSSEQDLMRLVQSQGMMEHAGQQEGLLQRWPSSVKAREKLLPLGHARTTPLTDVQRAYADELERHPLMNSLRAQFSSVSIEQVDVASLINPLVWIDLEYVEELRAELQGADDLDSIKFAVPTQLNLATRVAIDADGQGVSLISSQKTVAVMPPIVGPAPGFGIAITFNVVGTPQLILASRVNGRIYLRNGMHRAYLLASLGSHSVPVVIVDENVLNPIATMYPSFNNQILEMERAPVIADMFNDELVASVRTVRTKKVSRIRVEEVLIPVD